MFQLVLLASFVIPSIHSMGMREPPSLLQKGFCATTRPFHRKIAGYQEEYCSDFEYGGKKYGKWEEYQCAPSWLGGWCYYDVDQGYWGRCNDNCKIDEGAEMAVGMGGPPGMGGLPMPEAADEEIEAEKELGEELRALRRTNKALRAALESLTN